MKINSGIRQLLIGNGFAQILPLLAAPILTRLYEPSNYGEYSLVISFSTILAIIYTGRLELAITQPKRNINALSIVQLSIFFSVSMFISLTVILNISYGYFVEYFSFDVFNRFVMNSSLLVGFLMSLYQVAYYYNLRNAEYNKVTVGKKIQAFTTVISQIGMSSFIKSSGLIFGQMIGVLFSALFNLLSINQSEAKSERVRSKLKYAKRLKFNLKRYKNYPLILTISHVLGAIGSNIPIMASAMMYDVKVAGYIALIQRVVAIPISVISGSYGDVFKQVASKDFRTSGQCLDIYDKTVIGLFKIAIVPFILFFFFAPYVIEAIFGESWVEAGLFAQIMAPMFFFRFVSSPISFMYLIAEKQNYDFILQIMILFASLSSFSISNSPEVALVLFSSSYTIIYIYNICMTRKFAKGHF